MKGTYAEMSVKFSMLMVKLQQSGWKEVKDCFVLFQHSCFHKKSFSFRERKKILRLPDCSSFNHFWMNGEFCAAEVG